MIRIGSGEDIQMGDNELRELPVTKGRVDCLPGKKEPVEHCGLCIHCREIKVKGKFVTSPSLAYCSKCRVTERVDLTKVEAVKCADRQQEGFHSITSIIG
jgi:hypothetical protein